MAQRWPSTDTSFPRGVPLGHQVEKKASAPSALYWRATPHEALPCFKKPVSSMTPTACSSASVSSAYSRTMSRNASASHRPQPRIACCRQGPGSPAAAARIQPVLRGSLPKSPSRNCPADPATRFWLNSGRIRTFTSRSDDAHNSKVVSTDAPAIHDLPQSWSTMNSEVQIKCNCNARMHVALAMLIAVAFALTLSTAARAATIVVNSLADPGAKGICALRDAITAANTKTATNGCKAGTGKDAIRFSVTGTISLASTLPQITDKRLTITGPTSPGITIDGGTEGLGTGVQVMQVASGATLELRNLTIAHGFAEPKGGGIFNQGTLLVVNSTFSNNTAFQGSSPGLFSCQGGAIYNNGTLTVTDSSFTGNATQENTPDSSLGGAISNAGTLRVVKSTFSDNRA